MAEGSYFWVLHIVLHTGRKVTAMPPPTTETLAAIQQVAARHGIPADLAGIAARKGHPAHRGLYEDPGGQEGLRYWDGRQWSPLLPPEVGESRTVWKGPGFWSAQSTADGRWTYAAKSATRCGVMAAVETAVSAACLILGLVNRHLGIGFIVSACVFAALFAFAAGASWRDRRFFIKLDEVANGTPDDWS